MTRLDHKNLISVRVLIRILVLWALVMIIHWSPLGDFVKNNFTFPLTFKVRQKMEWSPALDPRIKTFSIDDSTVEMLGTNELSLPTWNKLLEVIADRKPAMIYINKLFVNPRGREDWPHFVEKMKNLTVPVGVGAFLSNGSIRGRQALPLNRRYFKPPWEGPVGPSWLTYQKQILYGPHLEISEAFPYIGHFIYDGFGYIRPLFWVEEHKVVPHLTLLGRHSLKVEQDELLVNDLQVGLDRRGRLMVNFVDFVELWNRAIPLRTVLKRLDDPSPAVTEVEPGDTVVILPSQFTGGARFLSTPVGPLPAGNLLASMINSRLTGQWLHFLWAPELGFLIIGLLGALLGRSLKTLLFGVTVILGLAGIVTVSFLLFSFKGILVPWAFLGLAFVLSSILEFSLLAIKEEKQEQRREIEREAMDMAAKAVQESLIPTVDQIKGIEFSAYYRAAEKTGGDWYGIYGSDEQSRLYAFIGDVTGHGFSSALLTGSVAGTIAASIDFVARLELSLHESLLAIGERADAIVKDSGERHAKFMTMNFFAMDRKTGKAYCLNYGHVPFYRVRGQDVKAIVSSGGPLGLQSMITPKVIPVDFQTGDMLFGYTDGLTENHSPPLRAISPRQLKLDLAKGGEPGEVMHRLKRRSESVCGPYPPNDDCAFFLLKLLS